MGHSSPHPIHFSDVRLDGPGSLSEERSFLEGRKVGLNLCFHDSQAVFNRAFPKESMDEAPFLLSPMPMSDFCGAITLGVEESHTQEQGNCVARTR